MKNSKQAFGYHLRPIVKGTLGTISKIEEELDEFREAIEQSNKVLQICELCDIYGALELLAQSYNLSMDDLKKMSDRTKAAFLNGDR